MVTWTIESRVPFLISLFNFQGPIRCRFSDSSKSISHTLLFVKTFSKLFLVFFKPLFSPSDKLSLSFPLVPLAECLHILSLLSVFVNSFRQTFLCFLTNSSPFCIRIRVCLCALLFCIPYIGVVLIFALFYLYVGGLTLFFLFSLLTDNYCIHYIYKKPYSFLPL